MLYKRIKHFITKIQNNKNKLSDLYIIKKSTLFNATWYLHNNVDVKQAKIDPAVHYLKYGWKEYRDPSPMFSTYQYLLCNSDVENAKINPLLHYERYGRAENRRLFLNKKLTPEAQIVNQSDLFDKNWYKRYYHSVDADNILDNFLQFASFRNPSIAFYSREYIMLHPDVAVSKINPLLHYEQYGKYEGRLISIADKRDYIPPKASVNIFKEINKKREYKNNIVTIVASYSASGLIDDALIYLLKGLQEISDYIILVTDNQSYKEEVHKILELCNVFIANRHNEYDFGSYKIGYKYLLDNQILMSSDDLIFINDANYGPVHSFKNVINHYRQQSCDFYGLSISKAYKEHIQSFFYIFKPNVYNSDCFKQFIFSVQEELTPAIVIYKYEVQLTEFLASHGFIYSSFIPKDFKSNENPIPTRFSYTLIKEYKYPLLKKKVLDGASLESVQDMWQYLNMENPELYSIARKISKNQNSKQARTVYMPPKYNIFMNYEKKIADIQIKIKNNKPIDIVFLVSMASMFPAETLMNVMLENNLFNVSLYVIPDVRFGNDEMIRLLNNTYDELKNKYNFILPAVHIENNHVIQWNNVIKNADIVCYPAPYDISYSLYNPYYAVQQNILSIHINYGFFRSLYDRIIYNMDNYNNFWRVFLETDINYQEYKKYGQCDGANAYVVGYSKMDRLYQYINYNKDDKIRIIIAPHHSIDGGANDKLALSNFIKYADLFLKLPEIYPNIEFIFRPHPILFTTLKRSNHWGEGKVNSYIKRFTKHPNTRYSTDGDYLKLFAESDGIIQDSGSFLVEYFYTKKPLCYMLKSKDDINNKFNELGKQCLNHSYIAYEQEDIISFLDNVILNKQDHLRIAREKFADDVIINKYPYTSKAIMDYIINIVKGVNND